VVGRKEGGGFELQVGKLKDDQHFILDCCEIAVWRGSFNARNVCDVMKRITFKQDYCLLGCEAM
jgi:hypothetical protein